MSCLFVGFGFHDLIGNTGEWTSDYYAPRHVVPGQEAVDAGTRVNLLAAASAQPGSRIPRRVLKGGSYLCRRTTVPSRRALTAGRRHGDHPHRLPLRGGRLNRRTRQKSTGSRSSGQVMQ